MVYTIDLYNHNNHNNHNNTNNNNIYYSDFTLMLIIIFFVGALIGKSAPSIRKLICCRRSIPTVPGEIVEDTGENGELIITRGVHI